MDDKEKVPPTSEPNPDEGNQVNESDLDDEENQAGKTKPAGEGNPDGQPNPDEGGKPNPTKQSRKTDAEYAEERRKRKLREEEARKRREEEIRRQAVFEVKSGQVTAEELKELGLEKVVDDDQLYLVESLRKAKAEGLENPLANAYQALYRKQNAERAEAKAKVEAEEAERKKQLAVVAQDQANFKAKFGKTTAEVVKNEKEFMDLFGNLLDTEKGNFTELYTAYTALKKDHTDAARHEGAFPTSSNVANENGNPVESDEDFKKRWVAQHGHW